MIELLADNPILTLFLVIACGAAFGSIPFGPLRFGAAGALFIGLAFGALISPDPTTLTLYQNLGLGIFVYMVGLEAGESFFRDFRKHITLMAGAVLAVILAAVVALVVGSLFGIDRPTAVGVFSGALTSTPSLAIAQEQTGSDAPAVGYSLGYPVGVTVAIILVALTLTRNWPAKKDVDHTDERILRTVRILIDRDSVDIRSLEEEYGDQFVVSMVRHHGRSRVAEDADELTTLGKGDVVTVMATKAVTDDLVRSIGSQLSGPHLYRDPQILVGNFRVSNNNVAGNTIESLNLHDAFSARIIRIRRGDEILLANDDTHLAYGDIAEVVYPSKRRKQLSTFFGDSIQSFSELDWIAVAGGLAIGYALALVEIPLPGGFSFALGAAAGPLIAGLILGALQRTGRTAWQLPRTANVTLRQLGLMMFLAGVGIASGRAFSSTAFSWFGLTAIALAAIISLVGCGGFLLFCYLTGRSAARANGGASGLLGQPAVLQYALENSSDTRIMSGYTATFALILIVKIIIVPFMLM
ncbi:aspartate:alanine exchanger family transporter [Corynebacterium pacaense]|uniref:aspartate:alanine exchanger family transporter n=1 Tax=Corynebacterium pacaense TaxID=1816684 RepID=UPI0009BB7B93|nr:TrkA C-terminal domain-containing protein [Corynebacterium pacaense]